MELFDTARTAVVLSLRTLADLDGSDILAVTFWVVSTQLQFLGYPTFLESCCALTVYAILLFTSDRFNYFVSTPHYQGLLLYPIYLTGAPCPGGLGHPHASVVSRVILC